MRARLRRRDRGITLVEVLLAAVVVGAGLAVILSAMSTSIRAEMNADNKVKAARLLEVTLGRLEGGVLGAQSASGDFTEDGEPDFRWSTDAADTDTANLQQVTVTITWVEHGDEHTIDAVRLVYTDPDADASLGGNALSSGSQLGKGSLMGSGSSGSSGSQMGKGSLMGSGSSGASGSAFGSGSGSSGSSRGGP